MSLDIERSLLAAILQDPPSMAMVADRLLPRHFTEFQYRECYAVMLELYKSSAPITLPTIVGALEARKSLDRVPASFVGSLYEDITSSAPNAMEHYTAALFESYAKHLLYNAAQKAQADLEEPAAKSLEVASALADVVGDVTGSLERTHPSKLSEILPDAFAAIDRAGRTQDGVVGVHTGFADLDDILGGMKPGQLILLAARPAEGKTALAANIAANASLDHGKTVAYFTLEMTKNEMAQRFLAAEARVDGRHVSRGRLDEAEMGLLVSAGTHLSGANIIIDDSTGLTHLQVRAKCHSIRNRYGLDLVIVDWLGHMRATRNLESRNIEVSEISWGLKTLSKDLGVPVLAVHQFNRSVERQGRRPVLSDLRDSGSLEQDAHAVLFLHHPEEADYVELIVAKNRSGPTRTVGLTWVPEYTRFEGYKEL